MVRKLDLPEGCIKRQLQKKSSRRRSRNAAEARIEAAASKHGRNDLQPDLRIVKKPINALKSGPHRTRKTNAEQLERVITSIQHFGLVMPILIDRDEQVVQGHVVWEAARKLGFETIGCIVVDHLDPLEIEALGIALNRLGETGTWDLDILRERMIEIRSGGIELTNTGFIVPEIDQILLDPEPADEAGEDESDLEDDEPAVDPVVVLGDLFALGEHRVLCGDALEDASYALVLEGRTAQSVFSDAPYNLKIEGFASGLGKAKHSDFEMACGELGDEEFTDFLATYLNHCSNSCSKGAVIFACMDFRQIDLLLLAGRRVGLFRNNVAVWNKGSGGMTGSVYRSAYENVVVFCTDKSPATNNVELGKHGRDRTNVWSYPGANRKGSSAAAALADHPTPKPVELVEDALLDVTNPGDIVLDPFLGSGTTLIAAERTGRICCGIELDPKYVDLTIRRWERETGKEAIHIESEMTFAELAVARSQD